MPTNELLQILALLPNLKVLVRLTHLLYAASNTNASSIKQSEFNAATNKALICKVKCDKGTRLNTIFLFAFPHFSGARRLL